VVVGKADQSQIITPFPVIGSRNILYIILGLEIYCILYWV
jgi:hypothetical protein